VLSGESIVPTGGVAWAEGMSVCVAVGGAFVAVGFEGSALTADKEIYRLMSNSEAPRTTAVRYRAFDLC
jgi:hypothetical protein